MNRFTQYLLFAGMLWLIPVVTTRAVETISLAGQWAFKLDPEDRGLVESWPSLTGALPKMNKLPGTTDEAGFGTPTTNAETGVLTRVVKYHGPAWYQREIAVPESWKNRDVELFLERVIWESRVWIDGKPGDAQESLNTPHLHKLGRLAPGWHTTWGAQAKPMPHHLVIDLGGEVALSGIKYLPRQDMDEGRCADCLVFCSHDPNSWGEAAASVQWQNNDQWQTLPFKQTVKARYLKLLIKSAVNNRPYASVAELDIITPQP